MKDGTMFAFAGLWERWRDESSGNVLETFTVITTDPNELMEKTRDQMPVILKPQDYQRWLEPGDRQRPSVNLPSPYRAELMRASRVGKNEGNVRNDNSRVCVESLVGEDEAVPK
jgi:putative SOS response-associated peptidase YedK